MEPNRRVRVRRLPRISTKPSHPVPAAASQSIRNPTASWVAVAGVALSLIYSATPAAAQLDCTQNCRPTAALVPSSSLGTYQLDAGEITVSAGDVVVVDVIVAHWDPELDGSPLVRSCEMALDAASFTSGTTGQLSPHTPPCLSIMDCDVQIRRYVRCISGQCLPAYYDNYRPTAIFPDIISSTEVEIAAADNRFTVVSPNIVGADTGEAAYAGSVMLQVSPDATGTFTVDLSELPGDAFLTDTNGNTIAIEVFTPATVHVVQGALFVPQNRSLLFHVGLTGRYVGVRVTFADLAPPFSELNGTKMWVQEPKWVSLLPTTSYMHAVDPQTPGMWVAELGCTLREFRKWAEYGQPIHIVHEAIVPNSVYLLQTLDGNAFPRDPYLSSPVIYTTPPFGDVVGPLDAETQTWTRPDGGVDISDIIAVLDVFRSAANAPVKTRVDFDPAVPDGIIDVLDIVRTLNAFSGRPYPFTPSAPSVCP